MDIAGAFKTGLDKLGFGSPKPSPDSSPGSPPNASPNLSPEMPAPTNMVQLGSPDFTEVSGVLVRRTNVPDSVQHAAAFLAWFNARGFTRRVESRVLQELHERFITETGQEPRPWQGIPAALRKLRVTRREKRLPDGSRPVVYSIPRPRRRGAEVVQLVAAQRT